MTDAVHKCKGLTFLACRQEESLTLMVHGEKFHELRFFLNRSLNTREGAPQWLTDLVDAMEPVEIPKPIKRVEP